MMVPAGACYAETDTGFSCLKAKAGIDEQGIPEPNPGDMSCTGINLKKLLCRNVHEREFTPEA